MKVCAYSQSEAIIISFLIYSYFFIQTLASKPENEDYCDNLLVKVLQEIVGPLRTKNDESENNATFKRRCRENLACDFVLPAFEAENIMFRYGELYLSDHNDKTIKTIKESDSLFASIRGRLPSSQFQTATSWNWMPGPVINRKFNSTYHCNGKFEDISALFLFPWEINNAFHAVNDNVFAALGSTILNYLTSPIVPGGSPVDATQDTGTPGFDVNRLKNTSYVLYLFKSLINRAEISLMYGLLPVIYGERNVRPAGEIIEKAQYDRNIKNYLPKQHCLKHLTWGTSLKVFYRDSLVDLRRVIFDVLNLLIRKQKGCEEYNKQDMSKDFKLEKETKKIYVNTTSVNSLEKEKNKLKVLKKPKVVIVTRNNSFPTKKMIMRKLTASTEARLSSYYTQLGFDVIICCDFKYLNSISQVIEYFRDVDICVGIHGAGLTNCIFGRHGMVVVELQNSYNYGLDSFLKVAHMAGGHYLFYDLRDNPSVRGGKTRDGVHLKNHIVNSLVEISVKLHLYSRVIHENSGIFDHVSMPISIKSPNNLNGSNGFNHNLQNLSAFSKSLTYEDFIVIDSISKQYYMQVLNDDKGTFLNQTFGFPRYSLKHIGVLRKLKGGKISGIGIFWVFLNPSIAPYSKESILGPNSTSLTKTCLALPYIKFRKLTTRIKLSDCDKTNMLNRKPRKGMENYFFEFFV